MAKSSSLRQRSLKPNASNPPPTSRSTKDNGSGNETNKSGTASISLTDILRVFTTLLALALSLSYYLTNGDSLTFNYRPWFTRLDRLKAYARGPLHFTPSELSLYNGTVPPPTLPIYLSLNFTIFDVSSSPHTYGPGGSYHVFAGRDATRAFVTGCFGAEDLNADLRGVEGMFVPVEDADGGEEELALTSGQKKIRAEREAREARRMVLQEVERWVGFYQRHERYFEAGRLVLGGKESSHGRQGYEGEPPKLCEAAERARPKRSQLNAAATEGGKGNGNAKRVFKPKTGQGKPV